MFKWILLICLSWLCTEVYGQGKDVARSSEIVVIKGKSYYLHTVEAHQTLASISRAYGISIEDLKRMNGKEDDILKPYDVLKIPYVKPFVQQDKKYYYHRVEPGETLYSISVKYGLKLRRILKFNREFMDSNLKPGDVLRLPLKEIDTGRIVRKMDGVPAEVMHPGKREAPRAGEVPATGVHSGERPATGRVLPQQKPVDIPPVREIPAIADDRDHTYTRVALMLPFSAGGYPQYSDSLASNGTTTVSPRSGQFIDFYKGILLAVDSLRQNGAKIELHTYDTERKPSKAALLADEINRLHPDLIIGPVYGSTYKAVAEKLADPSIPMLYPLSSRSEGLGQFPNFVQLNPSFEAVTGAMGRWLETRKDSSNILHIQLAGEKGNHLKEKEAFKESLAAAGIPSFYWDMEASPLDSVKSHLNPEVENILVLPLDKEGDVIKVLPLLSALTEEFPVTVIGMPEWQTFTSVDHESFYKLNTKIFTYSYVDYTTPLARLLADKSHAYFCSEPGALFYKAFDLGYFFIDLAAGNRGNLRTVLGTDGAVTASSRFRLKPVDQGRGMENHGFFIVNFSSDYRLVITCPADNA